MNTFFASAGRAAANVVDSTIDLTKRAYVETGSAGTSFAAGWKAQHQLNAMHRRQIEIVRVEPVSG
jgi:hypothetical protein